jgi:HTH-type transcriptional regulator / antitoxin HigA
MAKKTVKPIRSEREHDAALAEIETYFESEPKPGTPEADRFELLALVIEDYESKRWPISPPSPVEAIRYRMETGGFTQSDLGKVVGSRQRASEILSGQRPLTLEMAWRLHREWDIPAEALIQPLPADPNGARRIGSTAITDVRYEAERRRLYITFVGGKTYVYKRVPAGVYQDFEDASSRGGFFNRQIRDRYPFHEVTDLVA